MTQWHPIFAYLLRSALQEYYEVQTNVPVGDLPREADIIVLRRASTGKPPFRTLWKHLTRWNILEFKGRSESARVGDVDLLVEVGLGIQRRLQEKEPGAKVPRGDVSFWYLANHLGKRFLRDVIELAGDLESVSPGLWRGRIVGRPLWLVSNRDVPIDAESVSVHLVSDEPVAKVRELAEAVASRPETWNEVGAFLAAVYPDLWKEIEAMARKQKKDGIDWDAFVKKVLTEADRIRIVNSVIDDLPPEKREELMRRLQADTGKKKPSPS